MQVKNFVVSSLLKTCFQSCFIVPTIFDSLTSEECSILLLEGGGDFMFKCLWGIFDRFWFFRFHPRAPMPLLDTAFKLYRSYTQVLGKARGLMGDLFNLVLTRKTCERTAAKIHFLTRVQISSSTENSSVLFHYWTFHLQQFNRKKGLEPAWNSIKNDLNSLLLLCLYLT